MKIVLLFIFLFTTTSLGQELNCRVDVNFENVPVRNRELLADFASAIETYINTTRFTNENWGRKIECSMNIFFTGASSDVDYSAQIVVVSQRPIYQSTKQSPMLKINDGKWQFMWKKEYPLYPNQTTFDPLTSFLDFYAMIIIGMDRDSFEREGGTPYFRRAQDIVNLGASSSTNLGWQFSSSVYSRLGLVNDIFSGTYSFFRNSIFDYHYGIDIFAKKKQLGQQKIAGLVNGLWIQYERLGSISSVYIRAFFDAKHGEIVDHLIGYPDIEIFNKLKKIDPPHSANYDTAMQ
jgi:hypothetical protein